MIFYQNLPQLILPDDIILDIVDLDWNQLPLAHRADRTLLKKNYYKLLWDSRSFPWDITKFYGKDFREVGIFQTRHIPETLVSRILSYWDFFLEWSEPPIVRLQIIYGGSRIPIHIDETRSVSLIYPISNHGVASTNFYQYTGIAKRNFLNPAKCKIEKSLIIDKNPVLLDVDQAHDITYPGDSLKENMPRISLNLKWKSSKFRNIVSLIEENFHV